MAGSGLSDHGLQSRMALWLEFQMRIAWYSNVDAYTAGNYASVVLENSR